MKNTLASEPSTLGEALARDRRLKPRVKTGPWRAALKLVNISLSVFLPALAIWALLGWPDVDRGAVFVLFGSLILCAWFVLLIIGRFAPRGSQATKRNFLLTNDRQGFMRDLELNAKTAVFDGSNIYHLGHKNGMDAQPLGEVADLLRSQGYRIICFFDANIFFTLVDHGAFQKNERHSPAMLSDVFGLNDDEIYVVPSGVQADRYILECLKHLPISFAVTNDQYRDYAEQYPTVMEDSLWRKGVQISDGDVTLLGHHS
ncbi:MAG: hypothetical protein ABJM43_00065 [Paracoccaceae bacterium]